MNPTIGSRLLLRLIFHQDRRRWGEVLNLGEGPLIIGRDFDGFPGGSLSDTKMSRDHVKIKHGPAGVELIDLKSSNGTKVNGRRISHAILRIGDVIRIGDSLIAFSEKPKKDLLFGDSPLLGQSPQMIELRSEIARLAKFPCHILIDGEGGSGRSTVASELHNHAGRRGKFRVVNSSRLSSKNFDEARAKKLFDAAADGTLFFDGIGEMDLHVQQRLAQILRTISSEKIRVVASTKRDLELELQQGRFRSDLFSLLAEWVISVPPLHERREDIPELIAHFLPPGQWAVQTDLVDACIEHRWSGNVRELKKLVAVAVSSAIDNQLELSYKIEQQFEYGLDG